MFVNVTVVLPPQPSVVIVPATAVVHAPYGDSVFVVEDEKDDGRTRTGCASSSCASARRAATSSPCSTGSSRARRSSPPARSSCATARAVAIKPDVRPAPAADAAPRESLSSGETMKLTDIFIRRPVLAIVVNLVILIAGLQAIRTLNVAPVPEARERDGHGARRSTSARTPIWCAASSRRRSSARSPPPTASTTSSRRACRGCRPSTSASSSTSPPRTRSPTSARASTRCAPTCRPRPRSPRSTSSRPTRSSRRCTLSFGSTILEDNQVTDYLIRVVQPRLSAIEGVQRADILGGRTFAIRAWLKPDRMAALNVSPSQVRQALAANNYLAAVGQTKGQLVQINLTATTDLEVGRRVQEARRARAERRARPPRGRRRRRARRRHLRPGRPHVRDRRPCSWASGCCPNANSLDVIASVRQRDGRRSSASSRPA